VLAALAAREQPTVVYFPDAPRGLGERHARPHLVFAHARPDLGAVVQQADAAVSYGSFTTTIRFLLAGKPLLLLPGNLEQYLLAKRVEQLGAALVVHPEHPAGDLGGRMRWLCEDPRPAASARDFARRHAGRSQEAVVRDLLRRIAELLAPSP
jgi:UDP:flavonoid glycosyltransferase YjiC (YdhE family)